MMRAAVVAVFCFTIAGFLAVGGPIPSFVAKDDGQWPIAAKDPASTRYSSLTEINAGNVGRLKLVFSYPLVFGKGHEAAPLVVGSTMYVVTPFPNTLYAFDLAKPGAAVKWRFEPKPDIAAQGVACCDVVNRGAAYADNKVIINTLDGQTIAVDAATGKEIWRTKLANPRKGETVTMAPMIARDKVLVGNSGGEFGVRGWLTALNVADGKVAWRAYSTGPDSESLIGSGYKPFYPQDRGKNLGVKTWPPGKWETGGGPVWGWISYDPDLDLVYYGTGNPGPWNADQRPGDNKWTSGIFARDRATGQARWFYQWSPHDLFDHDGVNESILLDIPWRGRPRKVLVHPERNGYVYVLDRVTGEVLSAKPFVFINSSKGVDLKTGKLIANSEKTPAVGRTVYDICPTASGAKDWEPSAYSPRTGLLYIPHANLCMDEQGTQVSYIAGTPFIGANVRQKAGRGGYRGAFTAWDVLGEHIAWEIHEALPVWSGAVVTAGDVVFYGTLDNSFKAVSARNGKVLWQFKTESGIVGQPITYKGPDGHQYVAILAGVGGWVGSVIANSMDASDRTAALGMINAVRDLPQKTRKGGRLYVFRLP